MSLDPSVLDNYRRRAKGHSVEPEHSIMLVLLDALEEAQAEIASLQSKIAYGPFKEMLQSPAHSGSGDTGDYKNDQETFADKYRAAWANYRR